jgi:pyruvate formate lyase activating enzyme
MRKGLVFDIQRFSPHDGPGIRTTVFLKGCPLHCDWCHNPESILATPELILRPSRCTLCDECGDVCTHGGARPAAEGAAPDRACTLCGECVEACPSVAREMVGREISVPDLLHEILRDRIFFDESGGGVTFSGGEPLAQRRFLTECLEECRRHEIHTAVDTCGYAPREDILEVASLADLLLFDIKILGDEEHRRLTGVSNTLILDNLRAVADRHPRIWLRVPVIPGINDHEDNLNGTARLAASLPGVRRVCLLPFHRAGTAKTACAPTDSAVPELEPPTAERMRAMAGRFEAAGIPTSIGG